MRTQWRVGAAGPTGLDYTTLFPVMALMDVAEEERLGMLKDIRVMESAALTVMYKK